MLGAIVVHNWQVARRAIALGLVFPSACVCVCVCVLATRYSWYRSFADALWHFHLQLNANSNPGFVDVHSRTCTCVQQTFKGGESPEASRARGENVGSNRSLWEGIVFTPASGETPVHQQWHIHTWKHLENTIYLFKTPTLNNIGIIFDLFNHVIPAVDELIKGKKKNETSEPQVEAEKVTICLVTIPNKICLGTKKDQTFTEYKPSCEFKMIFFFFLTVLQTLTVVRERLP